MIKVYQLIVKNFDVKSTAGGSTGGGPKKVAPYEDRVFRL